MLKYRLITGPILIAVLLLLVWADDKLDTVPLSGFFQSLFRDKPYPPRGLLLFATALAVTPIAACELNAIYRASGLRAHRWLTALAAVLGLVLSYSIPMDTPAVTAIAILATGLIFVFTLSLFTFSRDQKVEGVLSAAGAVLFAMIYLGLMFGFLLALRRDHSAWWIVGILLITKSCDTGAYFTGRAIGRHKLIPWLSPGKTWEGLGGGIALSMLVGLLAAWLSSRLPNEADHISFGLGLVAGAIFAVVGQLGDLTVSLFKRGAGFKDSSTILPGLGGVLDVLDSPLMVAPVAYWLLELM